MGRLLTTLSTIVAIGVGIAMLVLLLTGGAVYNTISGLFLQIAMITVAVTILMGVFNLIGVHGQRILQRGRGWAYSLVLLATLFFVLGIWIVGQRETNQILLDTVQVSVEAALGGLVLFALVFGAYRLMRQRVTLSGTLFTLVVLIVLIGALPLAAVAPISLIRDWLLAVPVSAGARGLLIGIALATVVTGIRVFIGQDRSYRE